MNLSFRPSTSGEPPPCSTYIRALRCVSRHLFSRNRAQSVHTVIHYPEQIKLVDQSFACTETRITVVTVVSRTPRSRKIALEHQIKMKSSRFVIQLVVMFINCLMVTSDTTCKLCWCTATSITCEEAGSISRFFNDDANLSERLNVTSM